MSRPIRLEFPDEASKVRSFIITFDLIKQNHGQADAQQISRNGRSQFEPGHEAAERGSSPMKEIADYLTIHYINVSRAIRRHESRNEK